AAAQARDGGWRLAGRVEVDAGFESALAAALGGRLGARVVRSVAEAAAAVEGSEDAGVRAIVSRPALGPVARRAAPTRGAVRLRDYVRPAEDVSSVVDRLLRDAWVVERISDVPDGFAGVAVTRSGV